MAEISKEDLQKEIGEILSSANLATTSTKKVRQILEKKFGVSLTEKRKMIDDLVMDYVNNKAEETDKGDVTDEEEEEEEEKPKKPVKRPAAAVSKPKKKARKESSEEENEEENGTNDSGSEEERKKTPQRKGKKKKSPRDTDDDWRTERKSGKGKRKGKGSGYTRAYTLSPALSELMGEKEMPRHEVVKRVWALIKEKNLYDPNNKQFAICDEALYKVFGTKRFRTFGMMKYLKTHFLD